MSKNKVVEFIEAEIVKLHAQRETIDEDLQVLMRMLKAATGEGRKARAQAKYASKLKSSRRGHVSGAVQKLLASQERVCAADVVKATGVTKHHASNALAYAVKKKAAKRAGRGFIRKAA